MTPKQTQCNNHAMFEARDYQLAALDAVDSGQYRNYVFAWHRRAGKDRTSLEIARRQAMKKPATYWHLFPTQAQARDAIWDGIDRNTGERVLHQAFPPHLVKGRSDNRTALWLHNGSKWQMRGSDDYNKLMGGEAQGVIFSEFALCDPAAVAYVAPIIAENNGWMMFISTYRGKNHMWKLVQENAGKPDWYIDVRTIDQTTREDGSPVVTHEEVDRLIADKIMSRQKAQQEFFMNPGAFAENAYFENVIERALAA